MFTDEVAQPIWQRAVPAQRLRRSKSEARRWSVAQPRVSHRHTGTFADECFVGAVARASFAAVGGPFLTKHRHDFPGGMDHKDRRLFLIARRDPYGTDACFRVTVRV